MSDAKERTLAWVERAVVGLGLCPFAREPFERGRVHLVVSDATDDEELLIALDAEIDRLLDSDGLIETTLLVHPKHLLEFERFNDFLAVTEVLVRDRGLEGLIQIASFHPDFRFADVAADDPGNWTNRAPYPTLHVLREASIEAATATHPDPDAIWRRNIKCMHQLSEDERNRLLS